MFLNDFGSFRTFLINGRTDILEFKNLNVIYDNIYSEGWTDEKRNYYTGKDYL